MLGLCISRRCSTSTVKVPLVPHFRYRLKCSNLLRWQRRGKAVVKDFMSLRSLKSGACQILVLFEAVAASCECTLH